MTYPNRSESYKEVAVDYEKRDFKALGDRPQTRFNQKQATFDNYGLTHPRNRLGVVYYRHPTTKVLIKIETDSGREWVSVVLFVSLLNLHNGEVLARNETTGICFRSFDYGCTWIPEKPEV